MSKMSENAFNRLPQDSDVEARARAIFRGACENTDSYHALRLGLARQKALAAGTRQSAMRVWAPLAGAAACCALVAGVVLMHPASRIAPAASVVSSAPIVAGQSDEDEPIPEVGSTDIEMVQNLDFYRWLATQPRVASAPGGGGH